VTRYLNVIRKLVLTYTLEPAGSHGVWGLDDHFFLPYIFGSAQYSPPIGPGDPMPTEGSMPGAPSTNDIMKMSKVDELRQTNMYFSAVGFIYDVKSGPFWEHSPILFDISGVKFGWGKVNKGMVKMYNAEVLSKFPVVQHFYFGSLFSWERDPDALPAETTAHMASQPTHIEAAVPEGISTQRPSHTEALPKVGAGITSGMGMPMTAAPWANSSMPPQVPMAQTRRPAPPEAATKVGFTANPATGMPMTAAPWARSNTTIPPPPNGSNPAATRAPWARPSEDPRLPKR
jgi:serine/threonine-protein phosphatase 2A activator